MLPPPLFNTKAADSLIMTYCNRTAYWIFHDAMPKLVDALLTLICRMWQRPSHLLFFAITPTYTFTLEGWDNAAH